ncbi:MAG: hypothetical protein AABW47_02180 [Nanoarchaeota archaeon]
MTSKQGHKRYHTRLKLRTLVGKDAVLVSDKDEYISVEPIILQRNVGLFLNNQNGFYFNGTKLPVGAVQEVGDRRIVLNPDYDLSVKGKAHLIFNDTYRGAVA